MSGHAKPGTQRKQACVRAIRTQGDDASLAESPVFFRLQDGLGIGAAPGTENHHTHGRKVGSWITLRPRL
jgi:hypothetical protein